MSTPDETQLVSLARKYIAGGVNMEEMAVFHKAMAKQGLATDSHANLLYYILGLLGGEIDRLEAEDIETIKEEIKRPLTESQEAAKELGKSLMKMESWFGGKTQTYEIKPKIMKHFSVCFALRFLLAVHATEVCPEELAALQRLIDKEKAAQ